MEKIQLQKEKADEFKNILSVALHEINTPLDSLNLVLSSLVKSDQTKGKSFMQLESDYEKLRLIVEDTEQAFRDATEENRTLFNNFLLKKKSKSIINLNKIVHKCVLILKNTFEANSLDIKITFGKEVHAFANENEVYQILLNIIRNAIEAYRTDDEKEINITTEYVTYKDSDGKKVPVIQIEDFADGILKEDEELIWQQNYSTKIRANKIVKGQGLFISKELAERNKIVIKFISSKIEPRKKEKGTKFILKFTNDSYE
ncbi:HAMP domain-containing sensor histidine kinase [Flavobacterium sp.]|uniref:sensor histidine kinase n=1 Tax=Flavobacterium sp. TaxID=239 RepID=UPI0026110E54|nr:HAMP domain-containing sensor histidine kinase [Flavobacterium sp.]